MEQQILSKKSLPTEVLVDIFLRLPADLLTTLKSKTSGNNFFSHDSIFAKSHSRFVKSHWQKSVPKIISLHSDKHITELYIAKNLKSCDQGVALKIPPFEILKSYAICGISHGVICLAERNFHSNILSDVYLCNPLTKEKLIIHVPPPSRFPINSRDCRVVLGFGLLQDEITFKVLRIVYVPQVTYREPYSYLNKIFSSHVSLYNVCTASWKDLPDLSTEIQDIDYSAEMVNDCLHWTARVSSDAKILAFDMKEETFRLMPIPTRMQKAYLNLTKLSGQLCIFSNPPREYFELWVMKEYGVNDSWIKLLRIEGTFEKLRPVGYAKNGQVIFKKHTEIRDWGPIHELVVYNEKTDYFRQIKKFEKPFELIQPFKESLISVRGMQNGSWELSKTE